MRTRAATYRPQWANVNSARLPAVCTYFPLARDGVEEPSCKPPPSRGEKPASQCAMVKWRVSEAGEIAHAGVKPLISWHAWVSGLRTGGSGPFWACRTQHSRIVRALDHCSWSAGGNSQHKKRAARECLCCGRFSLQARLAPAVRSHMCHCSSVPTDGDSERCHERHTVSPISLVVSPGQELGMSVSLAAPVFSPDRVIVFSELSDRDKERMFDFLLDRKIEVP